MILNDSFVDGQIPWNALVACCFKDDVLVDGIGDFPAVFWVEFLWFCWFHLVPNFCFWTYLLWPTLKIHAGCNVWNHLIQLKYIHWTHLKPSKHGIIIPLCILTYNYHHIIILYQFSWSKKLSKTGEWRERLADWASTFPMNNGESVGTMNWVSHEKIQGIAH